MSNESHSPLHQATQSTAALAKGALNVTEDTAKRIVSLTDKGPFGGFKKFISRGSMIDMAVGVVMGSAVTGVVNAIVKYFINPLIAMIGGKPDMSAMLNITFNGATISFGSILNEVINFLLIGVAVYFCIILPINKLRDVTAAALAREEADADEQAGPTTEERTLAVLEEIHDELKRRDGENPRSE
ncbi:large conductance mechanosensitive channel protein MscL [Bifidobacterium sp. SMB2]|uniref:large conductance mechanosensitive channel protein MscL n=1 Tax=Bifidobacterium sp. SMB2 TaxID=2661626 RepID=UPI0013D1D732|nr:large conductance mechanosensitive channel protein MscL [Bifidobacterium sp. SMB2]